MATLLVSSVGSSDVLMLHVDSVSIAVCIIEPSLYSCPTCSAIFLVVWVYRSPCPGPE
eukprot:CAMPEP_0197826056 /NCGR_PEP_ID=MMETSP1437-20131217/3063_1 /TAXON_ID=49252 ORGANISM="Eucampia antarctica, Strain CCMP1452" /NCGR_SAMPLE_ID=MMETSP1437 /ASSEMBLY_ACC=CAM_ASM_001096 /LENGTH=57 /DNA_ID=CAMNT_0043426317 /DNA_START=163 /DNA_END=336 /DNA_ORIENTATION=-